VIEVLQTVREHAHRYAERVAVMHRQSDGSYLPCTFAQLAADADGFARAFATHAGYARIIPILASKSPTAVAAMLGAGSAGYAAACLNPKLRGPQVEHVLRAGNVRVGVIDGAGLLALNGHYAADSPVRSTRWWLVRGPGFLPMHEKAAQALRATADVVDWPVACADVAPQTPDPDSPAACLFTSGSTGRAKGVLISHRDLMERALTEIEWFGLTERDVLLSILPFSFDVGLNQLISSLVAGSTLVILDSWTPMDIMRAVGELAVTGISSVPSIWLDFLKSGLRFDRDGVHRSLRYVTVSGGDLAPEHLASLPSLAEGLQIFKTYGQTEVFRPACLLPAEFGSKMRSVGRPFGRSNVYIVRDDGSLADAGESGEVVATGLGVMVGYLSDADDPGKLRDNPFHGPHDRSRKAVYTGDVGYLDEGGYLHLLGRRDAMLKIMGNRLYPGEVASQLLALPGVLEAEVVGVPCAAGDTRLVAFVILGRASATDLRRLLAARVPSYMVPALVLVKDAIPRTATGKPDYPALVAEATARLDAGAAQNA
jgi:acyl-CoA synthetase (AMP-forming)/AMP-acid ligase II